MGHKGSGRQQLLTIRPSPKTEANARTCDLPWKPSPRPEWRRIVPCNGGKVDRTRRCTISLCHWAWAAGERAWRHRPQEQVRSLLMVCGRAHRRDGSMPAGAGRSVFRCRMIAQPCQYRGREDRRGRTGLHAVRTLSRNGAWTAAHVLSIAPRSDAAGRVTGGGSFWECYTGRRLVSRAFGGESH